MSNQIILMGDVSGSRSHDGNALIDALQSLVADCNASCTGDIRSPLTVTLGDEFQAIATSLRSAVALLFWLEESLLERGRPFDLHYVVVAGSIETPVRTDTSHGMLGPGLTHARELLTRKPRRRRRQFAFDLQSSIHTAQLNRLFELVALFVEDLWRTPKIHAADSPESKLRKRKKQAENFKFVRELLRHDDRTLADARGKSRTTVLRRRANRHVREYESLRQFALEYAEGVTMGQPA